MASRLLCRFPAMILGVILGLSTALAQPDTPPGSWPQKYEVRRDETAGRLFLSTPFYQLEHDLNSGGAVARVHYTYGRAENLLVSPILARVRLADEARIVLSDSGVADAAVSWTQEGLYPTVTVTCPLKDRKGLEYGITLRTTYSYRWGYVKVRRAFIFSKPLKVKDLSAFSTICDPELSDYGYRKGIAEQEDADPFSFGVCHWGKVRPGTRFDTSLETRFVPRYIVLANHGIEGLEWFVTSDLAQWDYQMTGRPGDGLCYLGPALEPSGISVSISPLSLPGGWLTLQGEYTFEFYIGMPILEGHANSPFRHASFTRNPWPVEQTIHQWAQSGIKTAHFHHDGDTYRDGLFWRDGTYPPFGPDDMREFDRVIETCHKYGIRVATYFSNKELYPSTRAYKVHGEEWGRKADDRGTLRHNYYSGDEYGAQMCLKSGWLDYFESYVDTVLTHHALDGTYYDWNCALFCNNPLHMGQSSNGVSGEKDLGALALSPTGHWDIDELIRLIEWTRQRVGPEGLMIVHNTMVPSCVIENFADNVVAMEWGYGKLSAEVPPLEELPLEWDFMGARSRGVIGYGTIAAGAPERLHSLLALETLLTGVAPWPFSEEAMRLYRILEPLGEISRYRFEDWRNGAVTLAGEGCAAALYSRPGEAFVIIGNLSLEERLVTCRMDLGRLPFPLGKVSSCVLKAAAGSKVLDPDLLAGPGEKISVPENGAVLIQLR